MIGGVEVVEHPGGKAELPNKYLLADRDGTKVLYAPDGRELGTGKDLNKCYFVSLVSSDWAANRERYKASADLIDTAIREQQEALFPPIKGYRLTVAEPNRLPNVYSFTLSDNGYEIKSPDGRLVLGARDTAINLEKAYRIASLDWRIYREELSEGSGCD